MWGMHTYNGMSHLYLFLLYFFCRTEMASAAELSLLVQRLETVANKLESTVLGAHGSTTTMPGNNKLFYLE